MRCSAGYFASDVECAIDVSISTGIEECVNNWRSSRYVSGEDGPQNNWYTKTNVLSSTIKLIE